MNHVRPRQAALDPTTWRDCDAYCYGFDLWRAGYAWEAHEIWESSWKEAGRVGTIANFLKALIKLAAACVKAQEGNVAGVQRHAKRAEDLLNELKRELSREPTNSTQVHFAGSDVEPLIEFARQLNSSPSGALSLDRSQLGPG